MAAGAESGVGSLALQLNLTETRLPLEELVDALDAARIEKVVHTYSSQVVLTCAYTGEDKRLQTD